MMRLACLAALMGFLGACGGTDSDDFPVSPGGGGGGGTGGTGAPDAPRDAPGDGGGDGGDAGPGMVTGKVCIVNDLRALATCATGDASGLTVEIEGNTATTAADGTFTIAMPAGSSALWHVTGAAVVPSVIPFAGAVVLPVVTTERYDALVIASGAQDRSLGTGIVIATVKDGDVRFAGATVSNDMQTGNTLYDDVSADVFVTGTTGAAGVAWISSIPVGNGRTVTVSRQNMADVTAPVTVEAKAITFVTIGI